MTAQKPSSPDGRGASTTRLEDQQASSRPAERGHASFRPPRVFAIVNFKGGVGKTTTALNLAAAWAEAGRRVLLVDMDPSAILSRTLGVNLGELDRKTPTIHHLLMGYARLEQAVQHVSYDLPGNQTFQLDLVPSSRWLATVLPYTYGEIHYYEWLPRALGLAAFPEWNLDSQGDEHAPATPVSPIAPDSLPYDVIVIDCPPEGEQYTLFALRAATDVVVAVQAEAGAVWNLGRLDGLVRTMRKENPALTTQRYVATMANQRTGVGQAVVDEVRSRYADRVCDNIISRTVKFSEAMISQRPLVWYESRSDAAESYRRLAGELWGGVA